MNSSLFFDRIRQSLFNGRMTASQVNGTNALLLALNGWPARWVAYGLATAYHEVGRTMQPVRETFASSDREAVMRLDAAWSAGKMQQVKTPYWRFDPDGKTWLGRGYVQLTWKPNYQRASKSTGADLVKNPDLAMHPAIAARIMRDGMERGWFTGKKLGDYLNDKRTSYTQARRVINGTDKADLIAGYALAFEAALRAAGYGKSAKQETINRGPPIPDLIAADDMKPIATPSTSGPDKPWWETLPILRPIGQALTGLGITGATIIGADWKTVAVVGGLIVAGVAVWALVDQMQRRRTK